MISQLRDLQHRYADVLTVIGVHSGKYHRERETARIRDAALRLGNDHPIVNDRQFRVWRSYAVNAWPTIAIVGPDGRVLASHAGEFSADTLAPVFDRWIAAYDEDGSLERRAIEFPLDLPTMAPGVLRYPGKVAVDGERIAIADTGHNRVLIGRMSPDGLRADISRVIGSGAAGFIDGFDAAFHAPQGITFEGDTLYVADAENHAIRSVDLATGAVRTLAGTGHQVRTREDQRAGALSSPWDVVPVAGTLYIAMAGIHQLWSLDLSTGSVRAHSGSMREDIADGPHASAALAQPMGITAGDGRLFFADSESSAVRWSDVGDAGSVGTIAGVGLFDFGDRDGVGDDALLQHPQGIARHPDGRLLVADSYNDALRWVDPVTRAVTTWVRGLHEPEGVACGARMAYASDTNAHRIVAIPYDDATPREVEIVGA
ncbi:MAG TPA: alkyl hydroperoxide reductase [Gemmatimonadaceae bacterium]